MPKRADINSILIIGAGPIIIGQACEFDYSGVQACKALREEGLRVILVNSNPATIMTDPDVADATYIEPITPDMVTKIIARERPDALLPTMGGQTALNCSLALAENGVLDRYGVAMIGATKEAIEKAENRELFRNAMARIGLNSPRSETVGSIEEARAVMERVGLPTIIRPSFTLGGQGGGVAHDANAYERVCAAGLAASPVGEILVEESVIGWKEYEMEVVRDKNDTCIIVCSIENVDPMGVHTGDSITVAPALTLTDKEYQVMRDASLAVVREIGVETGGANVQFAVNPENGRLLIIEMNPRVSRSSALASKATGFPIAKIAAKLAVGRTLDELANDITGGVIAASFEPTIDYVVTKLPRFVFEKFPDSKPALSTSMRSVGEAMAIGRTFAESLQKGLRSLETGLTGLNEMRAGQGVVAVRAALAVPGPDRLLWIAQALREGLSEDDIHDICGYERWFIAQIKMIVDCEADIRARGLPTDGETLIALKKMGFSDARLGELSDHTPADVAAARRALGVRPVYKRVDSCSGEFPAVTPYMYSCYEGDGINPADCEAKPTDRKKVVILGSGPNRVGQGVEFDYCCVHAALGLSEAGYETVMVNCNPETVSTDYDTSDRLYFEPLTDEDLMEIIEVERSRGLLAGVIVQCGGQTPLKLAPAIQAAGIPILGSGLAVINHAEDRDLFQRLLGDLGLKQPPNAVAVTVSDVMRQGRSLGFPLVVRPSFVIGGRAMEIVRDADALDVWLHRLEAECGRHTAMVKVSKDAPVLLDQYLGGAVEVDVDAICDHSGAVYVAGVMEHVEEAGVHSGDSACSLPPHSLSKDIVAELKRQTRRLARGLGVVGLLNVQFAVRGAEIFVIEANPRASRTAPFVAKVIGRPIIKIAARVMAGEPLAAFALEETPTMKHVAVKEAVFPFNRFPDADILLGPEMKSTGEAMGIDVDFNCAFAKAQQGAGMSPPMEGGVLISVRDADKAVALVAARKFRELGFTLLATAGTAAFLRRGGLVVEHVGKVVDSSPNCVDAILSGRVQLVVNTTEGATAIRDSFDIRRTALTQGIAYYTTIAGALAVSVAIEAVRHGGGLAVKPLQEYYAATLGR